MFKILGALVAFVGVYFIFDARNITKRLFGFGDQNEASSGMKIIGFIFSMIGAFFIYLGL